MVTLIGEKRGASLIVEGAEAVKTESLREVKNNLSRVIQELPRTGAVLITRNGRTRPSHSIPSFCISKVKVTSPGILELRKVIW